MAWLNSMPGAIAQGLIWGLMAVGVYITFKILNLSDLTVDGSICTGAAVAAMMTVNGAPVGVAMFVAFVAGALCGLLTGLFHTALGIPAILSGILTQLILWSVNLKIMGKANQAIPATQFSVLVSQLTVPKTLLILAIFIAFSVAILYWLFGTEFGASVRATGCNQDMARAQGINVAVVKVFGLMLSNGLVALAGSLLAQYQGFADINMGRGAIVVGLAAVIIGDALFSKFFRNFALRLLGVILGGVVYYIVYQTVIFLGLDTDLLKMLSALVVAFFLAIPHLKSRYFPKKVNTSPDLSEKKDETEVSGNA